MSNAQLEFERLIDTITKVLSLSAKLGLLIGGVAIVSYLLINGHYPQGVSIGDGLLFLVAAFCFGVVCLYFSISVTAAGILLSPILIPLINLVLWLRRKVGLQNNSPAFALEKISIPSLFFGTCGVAAIYFLARRNYIEHAPLLLLPVFQYLMYCALKEQHKCLLTAPSRSRMPMFQASQGSELQVDLRQVRKNRFLLACVILIIPIVMGGVTSDLLKVAMTLAKVRIDNTTILLKAPYSSLLPNAAVSNVEGFKTFEGVTVIFRGVGNSTLVEMRTADIATKLDIPNDSIIIPRTEKK